MGRQRFDYDLVIVGGGSAGIVAGNVAGALGARVALVEKTRIGGECLWTGCVPSKALLHYADVVQTVREAKAIGVRNVRAPGRDDCAGAFAYVRRKIEEVRSNDATETMLEDFGVELFFGGGTFAGPHLVRTPQGDLRGENFLIVTGSAPAVPDVPGLADVGFLTNTTLFDLSAVPASLAIIGGGPIACEMGQALARLGCQVTIIEHGERLLKSDDIELTGRLTDLLSGEGIQILTRTEVTGARREGESKILSLRVPDGATRDLAVSEILAAVGRKANTEGLGLESVGVARNAKGFILTDGAGKTTVPHIWACADVTGRAPFSHMAEHEAKIVCRNILFPGSQEIPLNLIPWTTFTDPELAHVGLTEKEAIERYGEENIRVLRHEFRQDDRAIVENRSAGLVKVVANRGSGLVLGAHILGPNAGDTIHEWILAMRHGLKVTALADLIHVYPTVSVSNQRAAQKWYIGMTEQPLVKGALRIFGYDPREGKMVSGER